VLGNNWSGGGEEDLPLLLGGGGGEEVSLALQGGDAGGVADLADLAVGSEGGTSEASGLPLFLG
jgi:hypothetical protein